MIYIPEGEAVVAIVEGDWVVRGEKAAIAVVTKNTNQHFSSLCSWKRVLRRKIILQEEWG